MSGDASGDSLYDTLGVDAGASDAEVTKAYRRLAREHHPDRNPTGDAEAFAEATDAYDVLHDPQRRRAYDDTRRARSHAAAAAAGVRIPVRHVTEPAASPPPEAGAPAAPAPRPEVELHLTFDQAALGTAAVVPVETDEPCNACAGTGTDQAVASPCEACGGTGTTTRRSGGITIRSECPQCGGAGLPQPGRCPRCGGIGSQRRVREVTVRVPAGVHDGGRLRIRLPGGTEIVGVVKVGSHPYFTRDGHDLHLRLPVTIAEAALGAVVTVPTLDSAVAVRLPPGTPPGRTLRVRGKGVPVAPTPGDLLITVDVVIPTDLDDAQRAALEAFAAATDSPRRHLESPAAAAGSPRAQPS